MAFPLDIVGVRILRFTKLLCKISYGNTDQPKYCDQTVVTYIPIHFGVLVLHVVVEMLTM